MCLQPVIRQLYIDHNHITLLVTLLCMVNTPESLHCRPVSVCHIRLLHFAAAIKCLDLVSGIGYNTVPYFGPLGRFWYSSLTPSISGWQFHNLPSICNCSCQLRPCTWTEVWISIGDPHICRGGQVFYNCQFYQIMCFIISDLS